MPAAPGRRALLGALATWPLAARAQEARALRDQDRRALRDAAGRQAILPARVARVFAAGPTAALPVWSIAPDLLAGWPRAPSGAQLDFLPPEAAALPETGRLTGRAGDTASIEAVIAARADMILDYGSVTPPYAALADQLQARTRLPTLLLDGALAKIPETFRLLGAILAREAAAAPLAEAAARLLDEAQEAAARLAARGRPRVFYARGPQGLETGVAGSINTEILEVCGAENVAAVQAGTGGLAEVPAEQVLLWDPDWIVTPEAGLAAAMPGHRLWGSLRAVRAGRVALAPALPYGWVDSPPSVNRLLGLAWLPVLFGAQPRDALPGRIRQLHGLLYHRLPDAAPLAALLRGALPQGLP
ncbi:ABC transporter substrate-binding protein [Roseomonas sp. GC11]|uniref:ABC transporter substrate-binding protein n=1 Tax=Roseomonas sp. GC11 TaxID=2950546 RepID=UPI00210ABD52|nr:ABC transporter substrate-binding protein [Roseomonas sp. GC11]MCQ4159855.1 ABC transporter substrate-binding protein [Roseomonas sp. GC11]